MTDLSARWRRVAQLLLAALCIAGMPASAQAADDTITIRLDEAQVARLPERVATVVVGNPLIADVSLQQGGMMVLTGKGYGVTNLITLDRSGAVLSQQSIKVQGPSDSVVVVYRGIERESYSCTPRCERRITLGDSPDFFDATLNQAGSRNSHALGSGAGGGAPTPR